MTLPYFSPDFISISKPCKRNTQLVRFCHLISLVKVIWLKKKHLNRIKTKIYLKNKGPRIFSVHVPVSSYSCYPFTAPGLRAAEVD